MSLAIDIACSSPLWAAIPNAPKLVETAIRAAARQCRKRFAPGTEVSVLLCDDATIQALNKTWRGKDAATNVLAFPAPDRNGQLRLLGDIALAAETLQREAINEGKTVAAHLSHLAVHGFLHLLGFDHETLQQAEDMEATERAALARLGIGDPYSTSVSVALDMPL